MARPSKQGLDYFALDVKMNDEVEVIEAEHGLEGFAILIKLYQKIYSEGYYYEWGDKEQILFSNRVSVDRNRVATIVSDCIKWGIFNEKLYSDFGILTSRRIQDQYFTSTYKRVNVEAIKDYLLVDILDKTNIKYISISDGNDEDTSVVSDDRNKDTIIVSDGKSTQSKVKESKVKESKVKESKVNNAATSDEEKFISVLQQVENYPLDEKKDMEMYHTLDERYPELDLIDAIEDWRIYKLDEPLKENSNPRNQINNSFKKCIEWGKCLKKPTEIKVKDENPFNTKR